MPLIGIETYVIDFDILDSDNPKKILLLDQSNYLTYPKKPLIDVIIPGFTGYVEFPYTPNTIIKIDSDTLKLTDETENEYTADLPDGVYQIIMKVCPYDELFKKKCYLKTSQLDRQYQELLLNLRLGSCCIDESKIIEEIVNIDILLQSAKAETNICNVEDATRKYIVAKQKLDNLAKKINCK